MGFVMTLSVVVPAWAADDAPQQVGALFADCKTNGQECTNKIAEINFAMLVTALSDRKWCPTKETDDVNILTPKVLQWLTAHPETNNKTTDDGIELALIQLYPCKH